MVTVGSQDPLLLKQDSQPQKDCDSAKEGTTTVEMEATGPHEASTFHSSPTSMIETTLAAPINILVENDRIPCKKRPLLSRSPDETHKDNINGENGQYIKNGQTNAAKAAPRSILGRRPLKKRLWNADKVLSTSYSVEDLEKIRPPLLDRQVASVFPIPQKGSVVVAIQPDEVVSHHSVVPDYSNDTNSSHHAMTSHDKSTEQALPLIIGCTNSTSPQLNIVMDDDLAKFSPIVLQANIPQKNKNKKKKKKKVTFDAAALRRPVRHSPLSRTLHRMIVRPIDLKASVSVEPAQPDMQSFLDEVDLSSWPPIEIDQATTTKNKQGAVMPTVTATNPEQQAYRSIPAPPVNEPSNDKPSEDTPSDEKQCDHKTSDVKRCESSKHVEQSRSITPSPCSWGSGKAQLVQFTKACPASAKGILRNPLPETRKIDRYRGDATIANKNVVRQQPSNHSNPLRAPKVTCDIATHQPTPLLTRPPHPAQQTRREEFLQFQEYKRLRACTAVTVREMMNLLELPSHSSNGSTLLSSTSAPANNYNGNGCEDRTPGYVSVPAHARVALQPAPTKPSACWNTSSAFYNLQNHNFDSIFSPMRLQQQLRPASDHSRLRCPTLTSIPTTSFSYRSCNATELARLQQQQKQRQRFLQLQIANQQLQQGFDPAKADQSSESRPWGNERGR